jgi:hypothetical protein
MLQFDCCISRANFCIVITAKPASEPALRFASTSGLAWADTFMQETTGGKTGL